MRKSKVNGWNLDRLVREMNNKVLSFEYPIQRAGGQWDDAKKSLLIHSIACDFPIPPVYSLAQREIVGNKEKEILYILDGKQRLTSLEEFMSNGFRLHDDTPPFLIETDGEVVEYNLNKRKFDELPENVRKLISSFIIDIIKIENALDSEVEDIFYRLNNGVPLSTQQKAKAKLGAGMALKLKEVVEHPLMVNNASFTIHQVKQAQDEVALVQSLMLIDDNFEVGKFGTMDVSDYTVLLRDGKDDVIENLRKAMDLLHEALGEFKERKVLSKINFPFVMYASHKAVENGWDAHTFKFWIEGFKEKLVSKENTVYLNDALNPNAWLYKVGGGQGATKADKVAQRFQAIENELNAFTQEVQDELLEEAKAKEDIANLRIEREQREAEQAKADKDEKAQKVESAKQAKVDKADKAEKAKQAKLAKEQAKLAKEQEEQGHEQLNLVQEIEGAETKETNKI